MMAWRIHIFAFLLAVALPCLADSGATTEMTPAEYRAELDSWMATTEHLDPPGPELKEKMQGLPTAWRVRTGEQKFEISTEWLRRDLEQIQKEADEDTAHEIRARLERLRNDLDAYQKTPPDVSGEQARLKSILARPEFTSVRGPGWMERLKQRLFEALIRLLGRAFGSSAIPTIGKTFVYSLVALAVLALGYWAYRSIWASADLESLALETTPVSAKEWSVWLAEAKEAANRGNWRDAIHLAYWAGISLLEAQGTWRPDRARTPREYLRLMPDASEHRPTLTALTRSFEIVWYGKREADARAFSQTLEELEKLGCR